jgi:hypothetical protein
MDLRVGDEAAILTRCAERLEEIRLRERLRVPQAVVVVVRDGELLVVSLHRHAILTYCPGRDEYLVTQRLHAHLAMDHARREREYAEPNRTSGQAVASRSNTAFMVRPSAAPSAARGTSTPAGSRTR